MLLSCMMFSWTFSMMEREVDKEHLSLQEILDDIFQSILEIRINQHTSIASLLLCPICKCDDTTDCKLMHILMHKLICHS